MVGRQPKVVLVTGCSEGGIGSALCTEFASQGCKVYATARRLEAMAHLAHPSIELLRMDVTEEDSIKSVVEHIIGKEGHIDVLVNNAGVTCSGSIIDLDLERVKQTYDTNVFGILRTARTSVIPHMAARRSGTIVNIGSILGEVPMPLASIYSSSKAAVNSLTDALYMECQPLGISVVLVFAGGVRTNIISNMKSRFSIPSTTLYKDYADVIREEFDESRAAKATPPEEFARVVVKESLAHKPKRLVSVGSGSFLVRVLRWIPRSFLLRLLWNQLVEKRRVVLAKSK